MAADIGHNGGPPLQDRTFKKRWAMAIFCHPKKPAGAVAMAFKLYMEMDSQGQGAAIPDMEFAACCGVSDRSVREFKQWLVKQGFVKIIVKGARGRVSVFAAQIPDETMAALAAGIRRGEVPEEPAAIAGTKDADCRSSMPEVRPGLPEVGAGVPVQDARTSAPTPARIEPPSGVVNNLDKSTTTTAEVGAEGDGSGPDFSALNGTAVDITAFIAEHNLVDKKTARNMLATNIKIFGADAMMEAFVVTTAEMVTGCVAKPYKYLIETARSMKSKSSKRQPSEKTVVSRKEHFAKLVDEATDKLERQGVRK